jgi:hypothetical protein
VTCLGSRNSWRYKATGGGWQHFVALTCLWAGRRMRVCARNDDFCLPRHPDF